MGYIYLITNKETGKKYVGQSRRKLGTRWWQHLKIAWGHGKNELHTDMRNLGLNSFDYRILEQCADDCLRDREQYYIDLHDCMYPNGYNQVSAKKNTRTKGTVKRRRRRKKLSDILKRLGL